MWASNSIARYLVHLVALSVAAELGTVRKNTLYGSLLNLLQINHIHEPYLKDESVAGNADHICGILCDY